MQAIEARVERVPFSGCWIWTGHVDKDGYPKLGKVLAHRITYEAARGAVPAGLELDHLCRVPSCVNPRHLEAVSHAENVRRGGNSLKTHCPKGHPLVLASRGYMRRVCLICERDANRRCYAKRMSNAQHLGT